MSENLIASVEPLLAPPVARYPSGISDSDDGGVNVSVPCCHCAYDDDGDDD
ncbi:MAG TPA: hypothetical protein VF526_03665 [Solirubrobacteraceae bacterium]|jgi:hypothetical protein